jgi:predicted dienelactone hydrolase
MTHMRQKKFFGLLLSFMIAAVFFAGAGCKPEPPDNCTAFDNATTPAPAYAGIDTFTTQFGTRDDFVDMYYPTGVDNATKLPMALLLQGGRCDKKYYSIFATEVAKYGFIVAVPNNYHAFKMGPMETDGLFSEASQMYDYIDYMKAQNDNSSSPFYEKVDTGKLMMLGHSYGAACTIYALQDNCITPFCPEGEAATFKHPEELKAAALCGINSKPRGKPFDYRIYPTENQGLPLAFVNGSLDNNATPAVTKKSYDKIVDPPKMMVLIKGANHYASLDINNPPAPGEGLGKGPGEDPNEPTISQEVSSKIAARWCALFLRAYGLNDPLAKLYVEQTGKCLDDQVEVMIETVQP